MNTHLTELDVKNIREQFAAGVTRNQLVDQYEVSKMTICRIINRDTWKHV